MTKSYKQLWKSKCMEDENLDSRISMNDKVQTPQSIFKELNAQQATLNNTFGMDLSRVDEKTLSKDQILNGKSTSETSSRSSRSNSVEEGLKIADNVFNSVSNHNASPLNSNFVSLPNCVSSSLSYVSNGQSSTSLSNTAAAYVNQDLLLRMAMQNSPTSANASITSNQNVFHSNKIYNDNLVAAAAAAVANSNPHGLYQTALNATVSSSNGVTNSSAVNNSITAHHLAALNNINNHSSAFQSLQQNHSHHQQLQNQVQLNANNSTIGQHNGHSNLQTESGNSILPSDHLLSSMTNGLNSTNQLLAVTNGLIYNGATGNSTNSTSGLSNNGSTNSSASSSSSNNSQIMMSDQFLSQNFMLTPQPFAASLIDTSPNNIFGCIKKRKRSPQPIPQDLKDEAYWDRRKRNNESAKRSREMRRIKEQSLHVRLACAEKLNLKYNTELEMLKKEVKKLHDIIYCQRNGQDNQQDKVM